MASNLLEEKLREASCLNDLETLTTLLHSGEVDVNSKNSVNGWTALHWAARRGNLEAAKLLLNHGANADILNNKGETPANVCDNVALLSLFKDRNNSSLGESPKMIVTDSLKNSTPSTKMHPGNTTNNQENSVRQTPINDLVLKVRVSGSSDPDFIEIEIPQENITYSNLLKICCDELDVLESQVERIRKLPNTRLRNDSDAKRLINFQSLELVLKAPFNEEKPNQYQSILDKNQTVLY